MDTQPESQQFELENQPELVSPEVLEQLRGIGFAAAQVVEVRGYEADDLDVVAVTELSEAA